jgi:hypothetical protein
MGLVEGGKITLREAGKRMGVSYRQAKRITCGDEFNSKLHTACHYPHLPKDCDMEDISKPKITRGHHRFL